MEGLSKGTGLPTGQPISQKINLSTKSDLLANGLTGWPTPYNWQVGYNSTVTFSRVKTIILGHLNPVHDVDIDIG